MRIKKYLVLSLTIAVALSFVACNTKEKTTSNQPTTKQAETVDTTKEALKNTTVEGALTDEEKKKVVELTDKYIKLASDFDYTKTTFEETTEFFKYTTAEVKNQFPDDALKKSYEGQVNTKQNIKVEGVNFNKIAKDTNGNITVDFSTKIKVNSHTNEKLNGKTFDDVKSMFVFDKNFKISAFTMAGLLEQ